MGHVRYLKVAHSTEIALLVIIGLSVLIVLNLSTSFDTVKLKITYTSSSVVEFRSQHGNGVFLSWMNADMGDIRWHGGNPLCCYSDDTQHILSFPPSDTHISIQLLLCLTCILPHVSSSVETLPQQNWATVHPWRCIIMSKSCDLPGQLSDFICHRM